jgi:ATP/ADP translocase
MHSAILFDKNSLPREEIVTPLRIISYLGAAGFLLLAYYVPFKKLFVWTVGVFAGWICVLGLCLLPFHEALQARSIGNWILEHGAVSLSLIACHWVHVLFYITMDIFNVGAITLIVWGIINQISQFGEAFRYYIPLAFTLSVLAGLISFGFNFLQVKLIIPLYSHRKYIMT